MNGFHRRGVCGPYPFSFLEQRNTRRPSFEERRVCFSPSQSSKLRTAISSLSIASRSAFRHSDFAADAAAKCILMRCVASVYSAVAATAFSTKCFVSLSDTFICPVFIINTSINPCLLRGTSSRRSTRNRRNYDTARISACRGVGGPWPLSPLENGTVPLRGYHHRGVGGPWPSSPLENGTDRTYFLSVIPVLSILSVLSVVSVLPIVSVLGPHTPLCLSPPTP